MNFNSAIKGMILAAALSMPSMASLAAQSNTGSGVTTPNYAFYSAVVSYNGYVTNAFGQPTSEIQRFKIRLIASTLDGCKAQVNAFLTNKHSVPIVEKGCTGGLVSLD